MATLTPAFRTEAERIHRVHESIADVVNQLDFALDRLVCYPETSSNSMAIGDVRRLTGRLAREFPDASRREEGLVWNAISQVSPQLEEFCKQMREEHHEIQLRLELLLSAIEECERIEGQPLAIWQLKKCGRGLTTEVRHHLETEGRELSGFL